MSKVGNLYSVVLEYVIPGRKLGIKETRMVHTLLLAGDPEQALGRAITEAEYEEDWDDRLVLAHHDVAEITQEMMSIHYNPQLIVNSQKSVVN